MAKVTKFFRGKVRSINPKDFTAEVVITDETLDRYKEIVRVDAIKKAKAQFMEHPVMLSSHNYRGLLNQIGHFEKIKVDGEAKEVIAQPKWYVGEGNPEADWGWKLAEKGVAAFSIGFIPKKVKEFDEEEQKEAKGARRAYEELELLEVSQVLIPANPSALQKGLMDLEDPFLRQLAEEIHQLMDDEEMGEEVKGVIPFHAYPKAPEGEAWNASPEVKAASVDDLKKMCTWYADPGDKKGDYKLPHHKQSGYSTVWRGVAAAMAALLGARGGTTIPSEDKSGVYGHLAKHYKQFGKEPPPNKAYTEAELKEMFTDVWDIIGMDMEEEIEDKGWEETENEIRHRLKNPDDFEKFRYMSLKKNKPRVNGVYGKYKGKNEWAIQSLRFPKEDGWTMAEAKKWVADHPDLKKGYDLVDPMELLFDLAEQLNGITGTLVDVRTYALKAVEKLEEEPPNLAGPALSTILGVTDANSFAETIKKHSELMSEMLKKLTPTPEPAKSEESISDEAGEKELDLILSEEKLAEFETALRKSLTPGAEEFDFGSVKVLLDQMTEEVSRVFSSQPKGNGQE